MDTRYSVGIPVRNEENTIVQTLESMLYQTVPPREIIVCANGTKDHTYEKVADMAKSEKSINLIISDPGKPNAWNAIVSQSTDNNILFSDGDVTINREAAENMLAKFAENKDLVIVGGLNRYYPVDKNKLYSRFFSQNNGDAQIKGNWICGRLYMAKMNELFSLADDLGVKLMPETIINEDELLDRVSKGHKEIIGTAYNYSTHISTFHDWNIEFRRILAGNKQIRNMYPQLFEESAMNINRLQNYIDKFNNIQGWKNKAFKTSMFLLRQTLKAYYSVFDNLDYNNVWKETQSTKVAVDISALAVNSGI
jgi:glycosyltransferase involved in cell wall biosynthesis